MKQPYDITRVSPFSGKAVTQTIVFDMEDYVKWDTGQALIQNALPYLTPDEREFLMTGIIAKEWAELFDKGDAT